MNTKVESISVLKDNPKSWGTLAKWLEERKILSKVNKEVLQKATKVMGTKNHAERWLLRPMLNLNKLRPVDILNSNGGIEKVLRLLSQIDSSIH